MGFGTRKPTSNDGRYVLGSECHYKSEVVE